ncbi:DUF3667 domain-containing protein [Aureitalea marina]|uniref:DUF3667 domain-containing protein n=1 Tax=Aureitalea marina TaxID=930804 RepID=A0A2S7KM93_9FLAO|nr:DUF3667 domain-containing protein [Aureitalea marina]PQB03722.1 hypothetical protein BST85_01495 [Aureitalea marina]
MSENKSVIKNSRKAEKFRGAECLNCGHPLDLTDRYCSYCSQMNTTKPLTLSDFFGEFIGSIITYDSRFRYTLKDLLLKPGTISRNYVDGSRLKYANPFRFFLSVSIIYFLVQSLITLITGENQLFNDQADPNFQGITITPTEDGNFELAAKDVQDSVKLDSVLRTQVADVDSILRANNIPVNTNLNGKDININPFTIGKDSVDSYTYYSEQSLDSLGFFERNFKRFWLYRNFYQATGIVNSTVALDSLKHDNTRYHRWAYDKNQALERIEEKPGEFAQYLLEKTPFFVFFFAPIYALFFWLIYSKKKHTYMAHLVFIFHIFSFIFLAMLISILPDTLIGYDIFSSVLFGLIGPFYFYKAMRNFYKQNRLITLIKFVFLNWVFFVSATIAALIFFAITAALY